MPLLKGANYVVRADAPLTDVAFGDENAHVVSFAPEGFDITYPLDCSFARSGDDYSLTMDVSRSREYWNMKESAAIRCRRSKPSLQQRTQVAMRLTTEVGSADWLCKKPVEKAWRNPCARGLCNLRFPTLEEIVRMWLLWTDT